MSCCRNGLCFGFITYGAGERFYSGLRTSRCSGLRPLVPGVVGDRYGLRFHYMSAGCTCERLHAGFLASRRFCLRTFIAAMRGTACLCLAGCTLFPMIIFVALPIFAIRVLNGINFLRLGRRASCASVGQFTCFCTGGRFGLCALIPLVPCGFNRFRIDRISAFRARERL